MMLLYLAACDRGCLTSTFGESPTIASALAVKQDCPTGLARCVTGAVEVTEGRAPCAGCPCAWKRTLVCERGCAIEGVELVRERDVAPSLCKGAHSYSSVPAADAATAQCPNEGERFWCHGNVVYACPKDGNGVPVAACTHGCAAEDETIADRAADIASAATVMCKTLSYDGAVAPP